MAYPTTIPEKFRVTCRPQDPGGWTACEYRGATIWCCGVHNVLIWPQHPYSAQSFSQASFVETLIDLWHDSKALPQGYEVENKNAAGGSLPPA